MLEGTASPSVLTHYLKLGTSREQLEQERLRRENVVLEAKAEAYASNARIRNCSEEPSTPSGAIRVRSRAMTKLLTYSELYDSTFEERFEYLWITGSIGTATFGFDRYLNQRFYKSKAWQRARNGFSSATTVATSGIGPRDLHEDPHSPYEPNRS